MKIQAKHFLLKISIVAEIASLGSITLSRQAIVSVTYLIMNNILFDFGRDFVTSYAIVSRMLMFAYFQFWNYSRIYSYCRV